MVDMPPSLPTSLFRAAVSGACLVALVVTGTTAATAAPTPAPSAREAAAPAALGGVSLDPADQASVAAAYRELYLPALAVRAPTASSSVATSCDPGTPPPALQTATLNLVNFYRRMGGLQPVALDAEMVTKAQRAALIGYANQKLDHYPGPGARCFTTSGEEATSRSLLAQGYAGADVVQAFMAEAGDANTSAAHRWFVQNPGSDRMGHGHVGSYSALWLDGSSTAASPAYTSWPSAGFVPAPLEPGGRWSFTAWGADTVLDRSKVSVTGPDGQPLAVKLHPVGSYGSLVFDVGSAGKAPGSTAGTYTVTVSDIVRQGTTVAPHRYQVRLFDAASAATPAPTTPAPTPVPSTPAPTPASPTPAPSPTKPPAPAVPTVAVRASSTVVGRVSLAITVRTAKGAVPGGSVTIRDGSTVLARGVPLKQGKATWTRSGLKSGRHSFTVSYSGTTGVASRSTTLQATVKAKAKPSVSAKAKSPSKGRVSLTIRVKASGVAKVAGTVTIKEGSRTRKSGIKVSSGKATWSAKRIKGGKHTYTVVYRGTSQVADGSTKVKVTVKK